MSGGGFECLNCRKVGNCSDTNEEKAQQKYCCELWEATSPSIINARNKILLNFGTQGLRSILTTKPKEE